MTIYRARLKKETLKRLPAEDRRLFVTFGHISNEVSALQKLLLWSSDFSPENEAVVQGRITFSLMFTRLLAGKLKEAHKLISKNFLSSPQAQSYAESLSPAGQVALAEIKRYFGRNNVIDKVRNNFAFHYSPDEIDAALEDVPDELDIYLEKKGQANTLYYFSEVLANKALLKCGSGTDELEAFRRFVGDVTSIAAAVHRFAEAFMVEFLSRYQGDLWEGVATPVVFDELPSFSRTRIDWFSDASGFMAAFQATAESVEAEDSTAHSPSGPPDVNRA